MNNQAIKTTLKEIVYKFTFMTEEVQNEQSV